MSHFSVLVIGDDVEGQLDPFWELDLHQSEAAEDYRAEFCVELEGNDLDAHFEEWKEKHPEYVSKYNYENAQDWMDDWHGYTYSEEYDGWGYWYNPDAKWDWYSIGGRWAGFLKLKSHRVGMKSGETSWIFDGKDPYKEGYVDSAMMGDINWEGMHFDRRKEAEEVWEEYKKFLFESSIMDKTERSKHAYWNFGIREGETKEKFIAREEIPTTFAVVKDGEWYEQGKMGWWGVVTDEKDCKTWQETFVELLEDVDPNTRITVVDCHI